MPGFPRNFPHIYLRSHGKSEQFRRSGRGSTNVPDRDREAHATALRQALTQALQSAQAALEATRDPEIATGTAGIYLDFQIAPGGEKEVERLEDRTRHIELVSVRKPSEGEPAHATVFVPEHAAQHFVRKVEAYRTEVTRTGKPKNQPLITNLETVSQGLVLSLYTDVSTLLPKPNVKVWWELWLRHNHGTGFEQVCQRLGVNLAPEQLRFPERDVRLAYTDQVGLARLMTNTDALAEIRMAKDTPSLFVELPNREQWAWSMEVVQRLNHPIPEGIAVCVLDTGMTQAHPLLAPALRSSDMHSYDPTWPSGDQKGHGTHMGGLVLYGDLAPVLSGSDPITLTHCLESVKMLRGDGQQHDPKLYGAVTADCISQAEIAAPQRLRAICMAVTSDIGPTGGRPSSWSAEVDQLCFGDLDLKRFVLISAGNLRESITATGYPAENELSSIENPAQAWNALTVGAYTEKSVLTDPTFNGWHPLAPVGDLSPTARTAVSWEKAWPNKPDIVLEGGNYATNGEDCDCPDDLGLLTTHHRLTERHFTIFGDTSAATALASNLVGKLWAQISERWPETIRGLVVHSAEWTPAMRQQLEAANSMQKKLVVLRKYGYGVPDYSRAVLSAANDLTLVVEDQLQPFWKPEESSTVKSRHMNLHQLQWPTEQLQQLAETEVELRVTLSYYIEPNPGERGWVRRHRYASHGLRFEVQRSTEKVDEFRVRINEAAVAEEQGIALPTAESDNWVLGPRVRNSGSLHSDFWRGTAAALAPRSAIAVYPVGGWWKENTALRRFNQRVRYALLVSIRALNGSVDIYTPVLTQIQASIETEI